jgi:hypothetical protein
MNLIKRITENGKLWGVVADEGEGPYPLAIKSLHLPLYFDALIDNEWVFTGFPYDFEKDGVTLAGLPEVSKEEFGIDIEWEALLIDNAEMGTPYREIDLQSKMRRSQVDYINFKEGAKLIVTRESFIKFLDEYQVGGMTLFDYLPLNYLVSQEVLFSPDELRKAENRKYRNIIQNRRKLNIRQFNKLIDFLKKETGLRDDFTAQELMEKYYTWGICGMRFKPYSKEMQRHSKALQYARSHIVANEDSESTYLNFERVLSYITKEDGHHVPEECRGRGFNIYDRSKYRYLGRRDLVTGAFPIYLESYKPIETVLLSAESEYVEYEAGKILISLGPLVADQLHQITLEIRSEIGEFTVPTERWNLSMPENRKWFFEEVTAHVLADELFKKTVKRLKNTYYDALVYAGYGSHTAIFKAASEMEKEDIAATLEPDSENLKQVPVAEFPIYLDNYIHKGDGGVYHQQVSEYIESVVKGDFSAMGGSMREASLHERMEVILYVDYFRMIMRFGGTTPQELAAVCKNVTANDYKFRVTTPNLGQIEFPIYDGQAIIDNYESTKIQLRQDSYYVDEKGNAALCLDYVLNVYSELGGKGLSKPKHVAIQYLSFIVSPKGREYAEGWKAYCEIKRIVEKAIEDNVPYRKVASESKSVYMLVAKNIYKVAQTGKISLPASITSEEFGVEEWVVTAIRKSLKRRFETIWGYMTDSVELTGHLFRVCINAIITKDCVIPLSELKIMSLTPTIADLRAVPAQKKQEWFQKGLIPGATFDGIEPYHDQYVTLELAGSRHLNFSLMKYWNWAREEFKFHPVSKELRFPYYGKIILPAVFWQNADEDVAEESEYLDMQGFEAEDIFPHVEKHAWGIDAPNTITMGDVLRDYPEYSRLFELRVNMIEDTETLKEGRFIDAQGLATIQPNFDKLYLDFEFPQSATRMKEIVGTTVYWADGTETSLRGVETLSTDDYAVIYMENGSYLIESVANKRYTIL